MKQTIEYGEAGVQLVLLDPLEKVFPDETPVPSPLFASIEALRGECASFQIAYSCVGFRAGERTLHVKAARVRVETPLGAAVHVRAVRCVPCEYPAHPNADANYLRKAPGLFPDRLEELPAGRVIFTAGQWKSLWLDVTAAPDAQPGTYPVRVTFEDEAAHAPVASLETEVRILPALLPAQTFPRTEWFYADCLADHYGVEVFSEEHWRILEAFIATAAKRGITMILTPQFTPPLDTAEGLERTPVQLVGVKKTADGYTFDFTKLIRWFTMCRKCGVRYFELSHLFSQWGAVAAPCIQAEVDGETRRIFGWDTPAVGGEYTRFLHAYLPQLRSLLRDMGLEDAAYFHISDEPHLSQIATYRAAKESIADVMAGCKFFDALSDLEFYRQGLVDRPVCATNHIAPFLAAKTPGLWAYYCTAQGVDVSNCFLAMPGARTRIYGVQLYKFGIEGCLHWGYNFYNAMDSVYRVDPHCVTDCGGVYPGGDAFLVYPGADGTPEESVRLLQLDEAMADLRALQALEAKLGREKVLALIDDGLETPLTFDVFPRRPQDRDYLLRLRARVNRLLCEPAAD